LIGRAGLIPIEAAQLHPSLETDQALRAALTVLPHAHFSLPCKKGPQEIAFSPDGNTLLVADGDHVLRRWNLPKHEQEWELPLDRKSQVVGISNDLSQLGTWDGKMLSIQMLKDHRVVPLPFKTEMNGPDEVVFSPDGRFCIARTNHRSWIFETAAGGFVNKGKWAAAFDPKGEPLGCPEERTGFKMFAVKTGRVIAMLPGFETAEPSDAGAGESDDDGRVFTTSLSRNGKFAATWYGQRVRVHEVATQRLLGEITTDQGVIDAQVDNRGGFVVLRGVRGVQTRIWALSPLKEFGRFSDSSVSRVRFSPDGSCFATVGDWLNSVRLWRTIGGEKVTTIKTKRDAETGSSGMAAIDPSGGFLAIAGTADEVWLCAVKGGQKLATLLTGESLTSLRAGSANRSSQPAERMEPRYGISHGPTEKSPPRRILLLSSSEAMK
jgi:WD40 repeat protein